MNTKWNILIVDDEEDITSLLASLIKFELPVNTTQLKNGEEAIQHLRDQKFDLIICDYSMPLKNGYAVLQQNHELYNAPFIMLTGDFPEKYPELSSIKDFNVHNEVITKPFSPDTIVAMIKKILV